jgi:glycosyltransferase involved in cell wall biosynthesis
VDFNSRSGPNSFGSRLARELIILGHNIVTSNKENYDCCLCFIEPNLPIEKNKRFVLRLDGIWFKPDQFVTHNRNIKWAYDNCDYVVWQSNFDKKMTQKWWGKKNGSVISNGIFLENKQVLHPEIKKIKEQYEKIFVCAANWHRQKRLKENIDLFLKNSSKKDALLVLGSNPDHIVKDNRILYLGNIPHDLCLQIYSISDWFIHLAWLDHCPNVVVEAISQGCPVMCTDSGGTHEIVKSNGIILEEQKKYNFELTDYDNPYDLEIPEINFKKIEIKNDYLDIKKVAIKYEKILTGE